MTGSYCIGILRTFYMYITYLCKKIFGYLITYNHHQYNLPVYWLILVVTLPEQVTSEHFQRLFVLSIRETKIQVNFVVFIICPCTPEFQLFHTLSDARNKNRLQSVRLPYNYTAIKWNELLSELYNSGIVYNNMYYCRIYSLLSNT